MKGIHFTISRGIETNTWSLCNTFDNRAVTMGDWCLSCSPHYVTLSISATCCAAAKRSTITVCSHIAVIIQSNSYIERYEMATTTIIITIIIDVDGVAINVAHKSSLGNRNRISKFGYDWQDDFNCESVCTNQRRVPVISQFHSQKPFPLFLKEEKNIEIIWDSKLSRILRLPLSNQHIFGYLFTLKYGNLLPRYNDEFNLQCKWHEIRCNDREEKRNVI